MQSATDRTYVVDVNGDGLPDIVHGPDANGKWYVMQNTGSGFVDKGAWITGAYGGWNGARVHPMDVNGDGKSDLVIGPDAYGNWYVLQSTGTSFVDKGAWISGAYSGWDSSPCCSYHSAIFNGSFATYSGETEKIKRLS